MPDAAIWDGDREMRAAADAERKRHRQARQERRFATSCTTTIMATTYPPLRWSVPGYVPEGLTLLAGRQKLGKTWLALDFAIAVAIGGFTMGSIE
jgi:hypothetical protein